MEENERADEQYEKLLKQVEAGASQSIVDASQVSLKLKRRRKGGPRQRKKRARPRARHSMGEKKEGKAEGEAFKEKNALPSACTHAHLQCDTICEQIIHVHVMSFHSLFQ
jgi:hypothetical protein